MKKQKLTPLQYQRANRVLFIVMTLCYAIFCNIELNLSNSGQSVGHVLARVGIYIGAIAVSAMAATVFAKKKLGMLIMAVTFLVAYAVIVMEGNAASLAMGYVAVIGFMVYLNAPLVFIGTMCALIICIIKTALLKSAGDTVGYWFGNITTMGMLISVLASNRAISLLIRFSKENQKEIEDAATQREAVAQKVSGIVGELDHEFHGVLTELEEINQSMDVARTSMDEISNSSESTAEAVNHQAEMTGEIQNRLENTNETATNAKEITDKMKVIVENGKQLADDLKEQSVLVDQNTTQISQIVELLVRNVEQVSTITASILNISSQTNLLALNASIEAARAGEAGRGFAVVADQIRILAEETKVSTEQITAIIGELTTVTNETREGIKQSIESINVQRQKVEEVTTSFAEVENGMTELEAGVDSISQEISEVLGANRAIVDSISTLSAASQEVLAGTQMSKETIENTFDKLSGFSETVEGTFTQLQTLKEVSEQ